MPDERYTFETARIRLEEIAVEVRKKDTSLEKSLDLLEEGVRLANICTELVDHTDLSATVTQELPEPGEDEPALEDEAAEGPDHAALDADATDAEDADDRGPEREETGGELPHDAGVQDPTEDEAVQGPEAGALDETEDDLHEPARPDSEG